MLYNEFMSKAVFESMVYWSTHSFPPVLDAVEILEDSPRQYVDVKAVADAWIKHTGLALDFDRGIREAANCKNSTGLISIPLKGMDDSTTAEFVLGGTTNSRRIKLEATNRVFSAIQTGQKPDNGDLVVAKSVARRYLQKTAVAMGEYLD